MQAILITAYKNYNHLKDLVDYFDENYSIYIHLDKKSSIEKEKIEALRKISNVHLVSQKYKVNWGGLNHLKAILHLVKEALGNNRNTYFHLITGHDYPIKSLSSFSDFYEKNKNKNFMEYHPLPYYAWDNGGMDRLSYYNFYDLMDGRQGIGEFFIKKSLRIQKLLGFKRNFYNDFPQLYGGSTYWSLTRYSLEYACQYMNKNPLFLKRFEYSFCAEEIFFQTILLNSDDRKNNIVQNNLRFIVWEKRNGNFPANLDERDVDAILKSDALFARKFEYPVSSKLLSEIKQMIIKKHPQS